VDGVLVDGPASVVWAAAALRVEPAMWSLV
jgi:hypothetical protein